jgi:hypothetical protein
MYFEGQEDSTPSFSISRTIFLPLYRVFKAEFCEVLKDFPLNLKQTRHNKLNKSPFLNGSS